MSISGAEPIGRLVLDTSAYSRFRAGNETVLVTFDPHFDHVPGLDCLVLAQ